MYAEIKAARWLSSANCYTTSQLASEDWWRCPPDDSAESTGGRLGWPLHTQPNEPRTNPESPLGLTGPIPRGRRLANVVQWAADQSYRRKTLSVGQHERSQDCGRTTRADIGLPMATRGQPTVVSRFTRLQSRAGRPNVDLVARLSYQCVMRQGLFVPDALIVSPDDEI